MKTLIFILIDFFDYYNHIFIYYNYLSNNKVDCFVQLHQGKRSLILLKDRV